MAILATRRKWLLTSLCAASWSPCSRQRLASMNSSCGSSIGTCRISSRDVFVKTRGDRGFEQQHVLALGLGQRGDQGAYDRGVRVRDARAEVEVHGHGGVAVMSTNHVRPP